MANEVSHRHSATGENLYFTIRKGSGQMWNTAGTPNFEALTVLNWGDYDIALAETPASSYFYVGTMPPIAGNFVAGYYWIDVFKRAGGSPAIADVIQASYWGYWDGTTFKFWADDTTHISGTLQTAKDVGNALPTAVPGADGGLPTTNGTKINQTVDLTGGQSIAASSVPAVTLADGAHGGAAASLTLAVPLAVEATVVAGFAAGAKEDDGRLENTENQASNAASAASDAAAAGAELENRLTTGRAGYLDYLNIGGLAASQADIQGITQAQRVRIIPPAMMERPDTGSLAYRIWIYAYDAQHIAEDLDANPTVTAENNTGTDRSANLGTVTKPGGTAGQYYVDYTVASTHAIEGLVVKVNATESAVTTQYAAASIVVDTTAVDFTAADRTKLEAIHTKLPSKSYVVGTDNSDGDVEMDDATGNFPGTVASVAGKIPLTSQESRDAMKLAPSSGDPAAGSVDKHLDDAALEATLTAIKGASWSAETLKAIKDAVDLKLATSAYTAPDNTGIDALEAAVGTAGVGEANLHAKLGGYVGGSGDNKNVKDDIANIAGSGGGSAYPSLVITPTGTFAQVGNVSRWDIYTLSANGVPATPDSTPTASLRKPDGTEHSALTVTNVATGHYTTTWTPATTDTAGEYQLRVAATLATQTYKASGSVGLGNVATGQGMGLYTRTIQAYIGPATTTPIAGATVHVRDSGNSILLAQGSTDAAGQFVCYLNAGTYKVTLAHNSYTYTLATMTFTASGTTTIYGTAFNPTTPSSVEKCTVYGWVKDAQDVAVSGVIVTASLADKKAYFVDATSGALVRPSTLTATTSAAGYWEIQLIRSALLTPTGAKYEIVIPAASGYAGCRKDITVPAAATAELRTL